MPFRCWSVSGDGPIVVYGAWVDITSREHLESRCSPEAVSLDVPFPGGQQRMPCRDNSCQVRGRGAGGEPAGDRSPVPQPQQVDHPVECHLLGDRDGRARIVGGSELVPRGDQPVSGDGYRVGATNHVPEESWSAACHHAVRRAASKRLDDSLRIVAILGQGSSQHLVHPGRVLVARLCGDRSAVKSGEELE